MKNIFLIIIMFFSIKSYSQYRMVDKLNTDTVIINKIKRHKKIYVIYAFNQNQKFKIVMRKNKAFRLKIKEKYVIKMKSFDIELSGEGGKIAGNSKMLHCQTYPKNIQICSEPNKGYYTLYSLLEIEKHIKD